MVRYNEFRPGPALKQWVACFYTLEHTGSPDSASIQRIVPDGCMEINFSLLDPVRRIESNGAERTQGAFYAVTRFADHYFIQRTGFVRMIGVRIYPWAVGSFANLPVQDVLDTSVPQNTVFGNTIKDLQQQVAEAANNKAPLKSIEKFLIEIFNGGRLQDALVTDACLRIVCSKGTIPMDGLIRPYGITHRRLQQRFRAAMGVGPKFFSRLVKFQQALKRLNGSPDASLTDTALHCGYFDQSHFIRDFKFFTGINPRNYLHENHALSAVMTHSLFAEL